MQYFVFRIYIGRGIDLFLRTAAESLEEKEDKKEDGTDRSSDISTPALPIKRNFLRSKNPVNLGTPEFDMNWRFFANMPAHWILGIMEDREFLHFDENEYAEMENRYIDHFLRTSGFTGIPHYHCNHCVKTYEKDINIPWSEIEEKGGVPCPRCHEIMEITDSKKRRKTEGARKACSKK